MRILLAIAILGSGMLSASQPADAGRRYVRAAPRCHAVQPRPGWRLAPPCRPWRYNQYDPTGEFHGFPGWARKAFADPRN
jgi:hypothetical protein